MANGGFGFFLKNNKINPKVETKNIKIKSQVDFKRRERGGGGGERKNKNAEAVPCNTWL